MGLYDIPAVIKYIKENNKSNEKIIYFGHSQGTTSMFSGLIQKYDFYKENIKLFVALAPIARLNYLDSTLLSIMSKISMHKLLNQIECLMNLFQFQYYLLYLLYLRLLCLNR